MDDRGFGRGFGLRLAGNNEAPQRAVRYVQYYSFLPLELQIFDNSGTVTQRWQGGAGLASIRRSYFHGDEIHMNALAWRSTAYASSFIPFAMAAGGDKGPLSAALKLMTIGNGDFQRGLYFGEFAAAQLAPYETRQGKSAFTILNLSYGGKLQMVLGRLHAYGRGALGVRLGNYGERENQSVQAAFPQIRDWAFGVELFGASLYRPAIHRLEFSVSEDGARFLSGRIVPDRQARLAYSWLLSK